MTTNNKAYQKEYAKKWYKKNKLRVIEKNKSRTEEQRKWFINFKSQLKCELCSESHPATLDFHHKDPKEKEIGICVAMTRGWSRDRILKEISKCSVLCSNCHRKIHAM